MRRLKAAPESTAWAEPGHSERQVPFGGRKDAQGPMPGEFQKLATLDTVERAWALGTDQMPGTPPTP